MHGFHPGCSHLMLNHLAFADDLLMFCKGNVASVVLLLRGFATFSVSSGLVANAGKSAVYCRRMPIDIVENILQLTRFSKGTLPL